jgi:hypothetical protein
VVAKNFSGRLPDPKPPINRFSGFSKSLGKGSKKNVVCPFYEVAPLFSTYL